MQAGAGGVVCVWAGGGGRGGEGDKEEDSKLRVEVQVGGEEGGARHPPTLPQVIQQPLQPLIYAPVGEGNSN